MEFLPDKRVGSTIGWSLLGASMFALVVLFALVFLAPFSFRTVVFLLLFLLLSPIAVFLGLRLYGLRQSNYRVAADGITIHWGNDKQFVPMGRIERILPGVALDANIYPRAIWWPGLLVGSTTHPSYGKVSFFATALQHEQLYIITDKRSYAISPQDVRAFLDAYALAREENAESEASALEQDEVSNTIPLMRRLFFWRDRGAQILLPSTFLPVLLFFAVIALNIGRLPAVVPRHFNQLGIADHTTPPTGLFILPIIGLVTWLANTALGIALFGQPNQRNNAYLLWAGHLLVQALLWAGALYIISVA